MLKTTASAKSGIQVRQIALVGLMAAVICVLGPLAIHIPVSAVPFSLGFLGIYLAASILGMRLGAMSVGVYLLLGFAGVPVFTDFTGGVGKLLGPTGGYLAGYLLMALICGYFADRCNGRLIATLFGMALGTSVCYLFGTVWLAVQMSLTFPQALAMGVLPYIPFDLVKMVLAAALGLQVRRRLKKAGLY